MEREMTATESRNAYMDQVVAQQQQLESNLRSKRAAPAPAPPPAAGAPAPQAAPAPRRAMLPPEPDHGAPTGGVDVRITGLWRWKTVLVPPNAFVVHTRRGRDTP